MSSTVQEITRSLTATIINEYTKALTATAESALAGNDAAKSQLLPLIKSWVDTTTQRVGAGFGNLSVTVSGAPSGGSGASSGQFPPQQNGFGQFPPQQPFGQFPPPQQQQAAAFGGGPAGGLPPKASATLQGCGNTRIPLTHSNQGCTCGVQHSVSGYQGSFYCTSPADCQNMQTQTWTCSKHKNRPTLDLKAGGKGSKGAAATAGGTVVSAQQVNGLRQPIGLPGGFAANPGLAGGLANAMAQQPSAPGFPGFNPMAFGGAVQPPPQPNGGGVSISNPQLSNQLMSSMQNQLNSIPQQSPLPGGAGLNMHAMMQAPPATGVAVGTGFAFPGLGGASPFAPPQQILPQQTGAPISGSDDDSGESSEEDQPDPIERAPEASVAAALANAMSLGGAPQQNVAAPPAAGGLQLPPNPALNSALGQAQQAPQQQTFGFQFPPPAQTSAPNPMAAFVNQALNTATAAK